MTDINAELKRRTALGVIVDWVLNANGSEPVEDAPLLTSVGTDGASPPTIVGTGVRGWLRAIYEKVNGTLAVSGNVGVTGTVAVSNAGITSIDNKSVDYSGTLGNAAGTSGAQSIPAGARIFEIMATALGSAGTVNYNGITVTLPYDATDKTSSEWSTQTFGKLTGVTTITFSGTDSYYVWWLA